jgi:hypothetical protein
MDFDDAALTDLLQQLIGVRDVAGQCNRETPQFWQQADEIAANVWSCYRSAHCLSRMK